MARKTLEEKKKEKKEKVKRKKEHDASLVFVSSNIDVSTLDPVIVEEKFVVKKGDRILVLRYDVFDTETQKELYTRDVCVVRGISPPDNTFGDYGETCTVTDESRGDEYGLCSKNPPTCGILRDVHFAMLGGKKRKKKRGERNAEYEEESESVDSADVTSTEDVTCEENP